jgi:putative restriction endonuclease
VRFWWVNQNQTYQHEIGGNYLWSPKRKQSGHSNPFYDFMREVAPDDLIFSFAGAHIKAIGIARSHAYEAPKPLEFGVTGAYWENIGWRVDVRFTELRLSMRPSDHMNVLAPLLPKKYAPLQPSGTGLQGIYLTRLSDTLAGALVDLLGAEAHALVKGYRVAEELPLQPAIGLLQWEQHEIDQVRADIKVPETTRTAIVLARRGQGLFKRNVMKIERRCRITGVNQEEHLRASHCKPWRDASNEERLNGENGLLLTPSIDHLFDRGFIGFEDNGDLLISPVAHTDSLKRMGLSVPPPINVGRFSEGQRHYLDFHRENVLLKSKFLEEA